MALVDRAKNILFTPATEWPVIAGETATPVGLLSGYALPLMLIKPVMLLLAATLLSSIIGGIVGHAGLGVGVGVAAGVGIAVATFVFSVLTVVGVALLVNALAPSFGGEQNVTQAFKLVIYSATAAWLSGVLVILPVLGWLLMLLAGIYSLYTCYLGLPVLMKCPKEKTAGYLVVIAIAWIAIYWIFSRLAYHAAFHF